MPAYAATIHKSQGSEYPAVIIPVLTQHYAMDQDCDERLDDLVGVLGFADTDFSKYFHFSSPLGLPAIRAGAVMEKDFRIDHRARLRSMRKSFSMLRGK